MSDLYVYQLETENKQLREALQQTRKVLEEQTRTIGEAIEYIKDRFDGEVFTHTFDKCNMRELLEILGGNK